MTYQRLPPLIIFTPLNSIDIHARHQYFSNYIIWESSVNQCRATPQGVALAF